MYSETDKKTALNKLVTHFKRNKTVELVVLLGSTAECKDDFYSDLDLLIVVPNDILMTLWTDTQQYLKDEFKVIKLHTMKYSAENTNISAMLDNFLELDIVFRTKNNFQIKHSITDFPYKIIYKKPGIKTQITPYTHNKDIKLQFINKCVDDMWAKLKTVAIELKRKRYFRASYEINRIREQLVEICATDYGFYRGGFRGIDAFDKTTKRRISQTYFKNPNYRCLKLSLLNCLSWFIDILEENNMKEYATQYKEIFNKFFEEIKL